MTILDEIDLFDVPLGAQQGSGLELRVVRGAGERTAQVVTPESEGE